MRARIVRLELQGLSIGGDGLSQCAVVFQGNSEIVVCIGQFGG